MCEAVNTISDVAQGKVPQGGQSSFEGPGELAAALDDFDDYIIINPLTYDEGKNRPALEERLESIISGAALMADSRLENYSKTGLNCFLNCDSSTFFQLHEGRET